MHQLLHTLTCCVVFMFLCPNGINSAETYTVNFTHVDWIESGSAAKVQVDIASADQQDHELALTFVLQRNPHNRLEAAKQITILGEEIERSEQKISVKKGKAQQITCAFNKTLDVGYYRVSLLISKATATQTSGTDILVLPPALDRKNLENRFGMNCSNLTLIPYLKRLGVSWVRFENMKWAFFHAGPKEYDFNGGVAPWNVDMQSVAEAYHQNGLRILPYIFQTPFWASSAPENIKKPRRLSYPPKDNQDYANAVFQMVARFSSKEHPAASLFTSDKKSGLGYMDVYELWNEPNLNDPNWGFWVSDLPSYFELFRAGAEAVKKADPQARASMAGIAGLKLEVVKQMETYKYKDGKSPIDFTDIINVHFYSGKQDPETATVDPNANRNPDAKIDGPLYQENLDALVAWRDKVKPQAEIWITETGNDVGGNMGLDERYQAAKIPRCMMMSFASGVERSFLYREKGSNATQHGGAGLLRNDDSVRPSFLSFAHMVRQFQDVPYQRIKRLKHPNKDVWAFAWKRDRGYLVTAWSLADSGELGLDLGSCTASDAFGGNLPVKQSKDIALSIYPIYIECKKIP